MATVSEFVNLKRITLVPTDRHVVLIFKVQNPIHGAALIRVLTTGGTHLHEQPNEIRSGTLDGHTFFLFFTFVWPNVQTVPHIVYLEGGGNDAVYNRVYDGDILRAIQSIQSSVHMIRIR